MKKKMLITSNWHGTWSILMTKLEPYWGSLCSPVLRTLKLIRISSDICVINHKNYIPYHTKCVSWPKDHFKAMNQFARKNGKLTQLHHIWKLCSNFCSPEKVQVSDISLKWLAILWLKSSTTMLFIMLLLHMMMIRLKHTKYGQESKVNVKFGILLQFQASCYRYRHQEVSLKDSQFSFI